LSKTEFLLSKTEFLLSQTEFLLSQTEFLLSLTEFLLSLTEFGLSLTEFRLLLNNIHESIIVTFEVSMHNIFCLLLTFLTLPALGTEVKLLRAIPINARMMTIDDLGNIYVIKNDNSLLRLTEGGDSSFFYRSVQNGEIGSIDATNPLKILLYYPAYSKVVILDRNLALKNELDLRKLNIPASAEVALSADGNLWIYDQFNARLHKIDEQLNEVKSSNDLRQELGVVPTPSFMVERNWRLFLSDTARGIFTFDRYGNYINTLSILGVKDLQVFGDQLVYRRDDSLFSWNLSKVISNVLIIPGRENGILDVAILRDKLFVLYADKLVLYKIEE